MSTKDTKAKLARVRKMGGRITTVADFLDLSKEDQAYVEMRLALSREVREKRQEAGWNQTQLAHRIGSDQSRIAKVEKADPSVSFDLLIRSLLALQLEPSDIASALMTIKTTGRKTKRATKRTQSSGRAAKKKPTKKKAARIATKKAARRR